MSDEPGATLLTRIDAALAARDRLRGRPLAARIAALAAAAGRWRDDAELAAALVPAARLSAPSVATALAFAAEAIDPGAMTDLVEHEWGPGAARRPPPDGPKLVAHVLASNVPALALPAIALGCLAGAAVLVKSGRDDPLSAPAFVRALAAADPGLAATVVTAYWAGGDVAHEDAALGRAEVVVATGGEATIAALVARRRGQLVAHGPRISIAALGRAAFADLASVADAVALDVALHDQRGCLSPHAVWVEGDAGLFAERLAAALDRVAARLPPGPASIEERARLRLLAAEAEWTPGARAIGGPFGLVIEEPSPRLRATCGLRTVRVAPLREPAALPALVEDGTVECVGIAGIDPAPLADALRERGVSRVCRVGRMQRPPLSWPRGQRGPLAALLGRQSTRLEIEP